MDENGKTTAKDVIPLAMALIGFLAVKEIFGKNDVKLPPPVELPNNGTGIPTGWTPTNSAMILYDAMKGAGTDEDQLFGILQDKTPDQLAAIYNEFTRLYFKESKQNLFQWFKSDLSGNDLARALAYFSGIQGLSGYNRQGYAGNWPNSNKPMNVQLYKSINCVNQDINFITQCI